MCKKIGILLILIAFISLPILINISDINAGLVDTDNISDTGVYIYNEYGIFKVPHNYNSSQLKQATPIDILKELENLQSRVLYLEKLLKVNQ
jgi:hypothetical protein